MSDYPSIRISEHLRLSNPPRYSSFSATAAPMAIPRAKDAAPPPLPPPQFIPEIATGRDPGWQWGNDPNGSDFGRPASVKPGSSLLGEALPRRTSRQEKEHDYPHVALDKVRRGSSFSTVTVSRDHEMLDVSGSTPVQDGNLSRPPSNHRLQGERQLEQRTLELSSNTYDKQLLSRIGGPNAVPNTPKRTSISYGTPETTQSAHTEAERGCSQLRPLAVPERRSSTLESPASSRWPLSGAVSPRFTGFCAESGPTSNTSRSQNLATCHANLHFDDNVSQRRSYEHAMFVQDDLPEERQMSHLNIYDRSPGSLDECQLSARAGTKRRASSPPHEGPMDEPFPINSVSGSGNENYPRRPIQTVLNRGSPISRFHPNHSSLSSASSYGLRHNSFGSSLGVSSIPSSATSYGSGGRLSPSALSPAYEAEFCSNGSQNPPAGSSAPFAHHRTMSESAQAGGSKHPAESVSHSRSGSISNLQGIHICECCPKKPKKFDCEDDLRLHESEKQYTCAYCPNRFKNKNEAERHQNSLHLRRQSWSCAALSGVESAFHPAPAGQNVDICGYCGDEFTNPPQWDVRAEHLNHLHKFGECNQTKKFYRADHFRQHLKHSHAGTSGKWTNMLEISCMREEPLPDARTTGTSSVPGVGQATPALPALRISTMSPQPSGVATTVQCG